MSERQSSHHQISFSQEMLSLLQQFQHKSHVSILDIESVLSDRGAAALLLILALPLISPIPLPGASVAIGLFMLTLAYAIVRHKPPALPKFLLSKQIEYQTLVKIVHASCKVLVFLEKFLRIRLSFMTNGWLRYAAGFSLASSAVALALPLPPVVPFTNGIPAFAIIFLALGFLEDDGLFIIIGHIIAILTWVYMFTLWEVFVRGYHVMAEYLITKFS